MKTIEIQLFKFSELSDEAKEKAINDYRNTGINTDYIYDEAYQSVKKFNELFGLKEGNRSWLDFNANNIDDNILNLIGLRLRTYIINNYWNSLYKGKYFSLWSKKDVSYKHYKNGYPVLKARYSKVIMSNSCVLTGVCYDESLLTPIYEFLNWNLRPDYNSYMNLETLISDCFANLEKDLESEVDYLHSDTSIIETIEANEYDFTEEGKLH